MRQLHWLREQKRQYGIDAETVRLLDELARQVVKQGGSYQRVMQLLRTQIFDTAIEVHGGAMGASKAIEVSHSLLRKYIREREEDGSAAGPA